MTTLLHLAEHNTFIKWFEKMYPHLHQQYGAAILPGNDDTGLTINPKQVNNEITAMLYQILSDYHTLFK